MVRTEKLEAALVSFLFYTFTVQINTLAGEKAGCFNTCSIVLRLLSYTSSLPCYTMVFAPVIHGLQTSALSGDRERQARACLIFYKCKKTPRLFTSEHHL